MRRAVVSSTATVAGILLLLSLKPHEATGSPPVVSSGGTAGESAAADSSSGGTRKVTGDAVDTRFGPVQVEVTLDGSRITAVDVVRYPAQDRRDQEINGYALPLLTQEAIAAQSADIDVVSGATFTSDGYTRSLQSALDKAGR